MANKSELTGVIKSESDHFTRRQIGFIPLMAGGAAMLGALPAEAKTLSPRDSRNKRTVREFMNAWSTGDTSVADKYAASTIVEHEYLAPTGLPGPEAIRLAIEETRKAVKDLKLTVLDMVEQDSKVWSLCHATGVEPKTDKPFEMFVVDIFRFNPEGKVVEHWGLPDRFAMFHQVGLLTL